MGTLEIEKVLLNHWNFILPAIFLNNYISELDKVSLYFTNIFGFCEPTGEGKQNMSKI